MRKSGIRNFPEEVPYGPWPQIKPTPEDKQYVAIPESEQARERRLRRVSRGLLYLDLRAAILKGTILGLFCFGIVAGIVLNLSFWLQGWHWAIAAGGLIVIGILTGLELTLVLLALGTLALSIFASIAHPFLWLLLPIFVVGGMVIRGIIELLPYKAA